MRIVLLAASLAFATPAAAAINLVTNGGFETGTFSGWTVVQGTGTAINDNAPHSGIFDARLRNNTGGPRSLSQMIATTAGRPYQLRYFLQLRGNPPPPNDFAVTAGNRVIDFGNRTLFSYTEFTQAFIAKGSTSKISFAYVIPLGGSFQLDDVSVQVVPEPESWAMLIAGFALVGAAMRRRRVAAA